MHPKMQTFSMQLADSLWLDHLALIDLMITMLTELSALASGITDSGGEAEPLILQATQSLSFSDGQPA